MVPVREDVELPDDLKTAPYPIVFVDRVPASSECNCVLIDNAGGSRRAIEYLAELGHTRIAFISGPLNTTPGRERYEGYVEAMETLELSLTDKQIKIADFRERGGYQAALSLLGTRPAPTAVLVANNLMSIGALKAFHNLGVQLPRDLSFVGFDDLDVAELLSPAPTVIARPMAEQGVLAMRLLVNLLDGEADRPPQRLVLDTHLLVRESAGPPPASASMAALAPSARHKEVPAQPLPRKAIAGSLPALKSVKRAHADVPGQRGEEGSA
jgi:LacI family transcriptional regulator